MIVPNAARQIRTTAGFVNGAGRVAPTPVAPGRDYSRVDIGFHDRPETVTAENRAELRALSLPGHAERLFVGARTWRIVCCAGVPGQVTVQPDNGAHVSHGWGEPIEGRWQPGSGTIHTKHGTFDADGKRVG